MFMLHFRFAKFFELFLSPVLQVKELKPIEVMTGPESSDWLMEKPVLDSEALSF